MTCEERQTKVRILAIILTLFAACTLHAQPTVALVLTGGGARGIAQIGVLKVLEQNGIMPDIIVGSSFGAIVGGLYASGYTAFEIDSMFHSVDWNEITSISLNTRRETLFYAQKQENDRSLLTLRFRNFNFVPPTAIGGSARFSEMLQEILWKSPYNSVTDFDSLTCRFRAVATNLSNGESVALRQGNLATAMRASATFPLRYSPVLWNTDTVLVDGGLVANIPMEAALAMHPDIIIVVNTTSGYSSISALTTPWAVADQALTAAMKQKDSVRLSQADFVLEPNLGMRGTFDFSDIDAMIRAGEVEGARIIAALQERMRPLTGAMDNDAFKNFIKSVVVKSTFGADTLPLMKGRVLDMVGRSWSAQFRRYHQPRTNKALRLSGHEMAFVRTMAYDAITQTLTINVDNGVVKKLTFDRLNDLRRSDIERENTVQTGDVALNKDLIRTWQNMHASDVLADADVIVSRDLDSGLRVTMRAEDRGNQTIKIGARIDNERYTQGGVDLVQENVFSSGIRIAVRGVISERIGLLSASLELPRIAGTLWTTSLRGYTSFRKVWGYTNAP
ncbi:MAG: patatin-like phospholipase family protein, partial [Candidatus Kapabacteria bacterium]|nr:patatin-like phospholipase family protein [Candidatus Kapabacteria bacterium]